jgi:hypothetical protein
MLDETLSRKDAIVKIVVRILVSSGREVKTGEFSDEPGVFYVIHRSYGGWFSRFHNVSGPFPLDDPRFKTVDA